LTEGRVGRWKRELMMRAGDSFLLQKRQAQHGKIKASQAKREGSGV
jgi:hypothetical protein